MFMRVLGSGSSGNCYLLESKDEVLVLEAGLSFEKVKEAIDYQTSKIVGVLSSHEHGDHRKYIDEYKDTGIPRVLGNEVDQYTASNSPLPPFRFGEFRVIPFDVIHDVPCYGYLIEHKEMGKLLFVTDTEYLKYRFEGINHIMVEANYAQDIIDENVNNGYIPKSLRDRIMKSHTSITTAKGIVQANKNPMLRNVILLHLSGHNSDPKRFREEVRNVLGDYCNVDVAKAGLTMDLNLCPF
nr:MAG TPA: Metal-dependent hydrolases of the beta-lactamase superfamily I [Caudoviricetes sp.]